MIVDGLSAIAEGENPRIIEAKLQGYLRDLKKPVVSETDERKPS
jgi:flagellar motor component MotA